MIGRVLLNKDGAKLELGLFGGMRATYVNSIGRPMSRKLIKEEAAWVNDVTAEAARLGVPLTPGILPLEEFFEMVVHAVILGGAHWKALFVNPPEQYALLIANEYSKIQPAQRG